MVLLPGSLTESNSIFPCVFYYGKEPVTAGSLYDASLFFFSCDSDVIPA